MLARRPLAAMSDPDRQERPRGGGFQKRLTATASGVVMTIVLAVLGLALLGALLAGLAFMAFAMPLTTAAVVAVLAIGGFAGWKAKNKQR